MEQEIVGIYSDTSEVLDALVELFTGHLCLQEGHMVLGGKKVSVEEGMKAVCMHTAVIDEHFQLVESLSLVENLCILQGHVKRILVHPVRIRRQAQEILNKFHLQYMIDRPVYQLTKIECIYVELMKAYVADKKLVIFDYRRMDISEQELTGVYHVIKSLMKSGMQFVFLGGDPMILKYIDKIHLMKRNRTALIRDLKVPGREDFWPTVKHVYGYEKNRGPEEKEDMQATVIFSIKRLYGEYFEDLNLTVRKKELVCLIIREGRKYLELQDILYGRKEPVSGAIMFNNNPFRFLDIEQAIEQGICFIEGNVRDNTLFSDLTVFDNLCMVKGKFVKKVWRNNRFRKSIEEFAEKKIAKNIIRKTIRELTAQEACQVMYYKWYLLHPRLAVCINPVGAADWETACKIKEILCEFVEQDISVLVFAQNEMLLNSWNVRKVFI